MRIAIGSDPNANPFKIAIREELESIGPAVTDFGAAKWVAVAGEFDSNGRSGPRVARIAHYEVERR